MKIEETGVAVVLDDEIAQVNFGIPNSNDDDKIGSALRFRQQTKCTHGDKLQGPGGGEQL